MPRETSAGAVIFRRENNEVYYLLLHYASGHWDFPRGIIEEGEKEEETMRREVKEETGIEEVKIMEGFKEYIKYFYRNTYGLEEAEKSKAPWVLKIVTYCLAETKNKEVKISFEHRGYKWLAYEQALEQLTFKNAKEILEKANNFLEKHAASS